VAVIVFALAYLGAYVELTQGPTGDGFYSYLMVQSFVEDGDLDLRDEFMAAGNPWGYGPDPDTGYLRMKYELWPLVVWTPFMLLGKAAAVLARTLGFDAAGAHWVETITLSASPISALLGALCLARLLRRHAGETVAWLSAFGAIGGSQLLFYALSAPSYVHALSFAVAAWFLERCDAYAHPECSLTPARAASLGLLLGALVDCRLQNVTFAPLVAWPLLSSARAQNEGWRGLARTSAYFGAGALAAVAPTLWLFERVYGGPFETFQGPHFMRWSQPWLGAVWFSSAGGLFTYTPAAWLGVAGLCGLLRLRVYRLAAALLLACFLLHSYVNACAWDYWGGHTFGARRASELLGPLAVGVAGVLAWLLARVQRAPERAFGWVVGLALLAQVSAYLAATRAALSGALPLEGPTTFSVRARAIGHSWAAWIDERVGDPFAFPANLLFALRHGVPMANYSCVVGRSFLEPSAADARFHKHEHLDLRRAKDRCLLGAGFQRDAPANTDGVWIEGRFAELLLPVHTPASIRVQVKYSARAACKVLIAWEGAPQGGFMAHANGREVGSVIVPASALRSEVQTLTLFTSEPRCLQVHELAFQPLDAASFDAISPSGAGDMLADRRSYDAESGDTAFEAFEDTRASAQTAPTHARTQGSARMRPIVPTQERAHAGAARLFVE
jgi:hypothetical protein